MSDTENDPQAFIKAMSGITASLTALKNATTYGTGVIIRTPEGFFEAPDPQNIEIREVNKYPEPDINLIEEFEVQEHSTSAFHSTKTYKVLNQQQMQDADVVTAIMKDGSRVVIKNRFGPTDAEK